MLVDDLGLRHRLFAIAVRGGDNGKSVLRRHDDPSVLGGCHLDRMVDEHVKDVFDVGVADQVHAQLAQRVGLRRALDRRSPLAFELSRHVARGQGDDQKQKHLADGRVGIDVEVRRREAAADEQIKE